MKGARQAVKASPVASGADALEATAKEAHSAYLEARGLEPVPWRVLDGRWTEFQRAFRAAAQLPDMEPPGSARAQASKAACLRHAAETRDYFREFVNRYGPLNYAGRCAATFEAENALARAAEEQQQVT